jgi:glycosyltransferase involved in cell wall biosynthesis
MRVFSVNAYDIKGGAARAAYRIHQAVRRYGIDCHMYVNESISGDWTVKGPSSYISKTIPNIRHALGALSSRMLRTTNPVLHSMNFLPSSWPDKFNNSDVDLVHLHWINHEMLSVGDISRIKKPIVWTLHDMWAFCGAEHYTDDFRWRDGYFKSNRPVYEGGIDLNRLIWKHKLKKWDRPINIVTPSNWLAKLAKESVLMKDWPVTVIPNAIDTNIWRPIDKNIARKLLNLPIDIPLLSFGAMGGSADPRKGFDLLLGALKLLKEKHVDTELIIFGQLEAESPVDLGFKTHYLGHLYDDITLTLLYSAIDVLLIPSRSDNLPNTGLEAHACGTPLVCFKVGGLEDIVQHKKTGYLAKPFDIEDFANGIKWVLSDDLKHKELSINARLVAEDKFSYPVVAEKYYKSYCSAINLE